MGKMFQINDVSQKCGDVVQHSEKFLPFAQQRMGFNKPVSINLLSDPENAKNPLGKTAYYDPEEMKIVVFVDKRHVKDIMRSLSHELVHHAQNCRGDLSGNNYTGPGYAQKDKHMRKMEGEAYLHGNLCFRDWEDSLKRENSEMNETKLRKYVNNLIKEVLDEAEEVEEGKIPAGLKAYQDKKKAEAGEGSEKSGEEEPEKESEESDEEESSDKPKSEGKLGDGKTQGTDSVEAGLDNNSEFTGQDFAAEKGGKRGTKNENWHKGNKDQLLFERLTKKWTK